MATEMQLKDFQFQKALCHQNTHRKSRVTFFTRDYSAFLFVLPE